MFTKTLALARENMLWNIKGLIYQIIENNFDFSIVASQIFLDSAYDVRFDPQPNAQNHLGLAKRKYKWNNSYKYYTTNLSMSPDGSSLLNDSIFGAKIHLSATEFHRITMFIIVTCLNFVMNYSTDSILGPQWTYLIWWIWKIYKNYYVCCAHLKNL